MNQPWQCQIPMNGGFNGKNIYEWYILYCPCLITGGKTTWQKKQLLNTGPCLIATQVVERGTYSELVSLGGHFAKLAARSLWENWRAAGPARKQALSCWAVPMTLGKWSILQAERKKSRNAPARLRCLCVLYCTYVTPAAWWLAWCFFQVCQLDIHF